MSLSITNDSGPRAGFTAIEMMVVVSIVMTLVVMVVPNLYGSIRKGRVHDAADAILIVSSQARQLARTHQPLSVAEAAKHYGMAIVASSGGASAYAAITYGVGTSVGDELLNQAGKPICKLTFNRNVMPFMNDKALPDRVGWFYQYQSGYPLFQPADTNAIDVGTSARPAQTVAGIPMPDLPESPVCNELSVRSLDERYRVAIAIYQIGIGNAQDF